MMIIGFLLGLWRAVRAGRKRGLQPESVMDASLAALIAGIIGARLLFLALSWDEYHYGFLDIFRVWEGGLSFHGGMLAAVASVAVYLRRKRIPFLQMADLLAPSLALAYAFTRIGCFLNGCCYGTETHLPWAVRFHDPARDGALTVPSHPAQLYAFAANLAIFVILTRIEKLGRPRGCVFFAYLILYSVYRLAIEVVRKGATAEIAFAGLTEAQIASVALLAFGLVMLFRAGRTA